MHTGKTFKQSVGQLHYPVACLLCPLDDPNNVLVNRSGRSQRRMARWRCNSTHTQTSALDRTSRPGRPIPSEGPKVSMRKDLQAAEKTEYSATARNTTHSMIAEPLTTQTELCHHSPTTFLLQYSSMISPSETKTGLNYIYTLGPDRAENALCLGYKTNQLTLYNQPKP
jgi:hypothetical protein